MDSLPQIMTARALSTLKAAEHACAFSADDAGLVATAAAFISLGLEESNRCIFISDAHTLGVLETMDKAGIGVEDALSRGSLVIQSAAESFFAGGAFDPVRMVENLRKMEQDALQDGFAGLSVAGDMSWCTKGMPGSDRLAKYEAMLETFFAGSLTCGLCLYREDLFDAATLARVLFAHDLVVINGKLYPNPFHIPQQEYLAWLEQGVLPRSVFDRMKTDIEERVGLQTRLKKDLNGSMRAVARLEQDVARLEQEETRLGERERHFRSIFEAFPSGYIGLDGEGTIVEANPAFLAMLGRQRDGVVMMPLWSFVPEREREGFHEIFSRFVRQGCVQNAVFPLVRTEGEEIVVTTDGIFASEDGAVEPVGHCLVKDITQQRREAEEAERLRGQLERVQRLESIGRLAGGVAHDFNNMLGVIMGHAELALEKAGLRDDVALHLQEIKAAAERSASVVRQLLAYARKQGRSPVALNLNETVQAVLSMLRRLIGEDIDLVWLPEVDLNMVMMDPAQVDQIVMNLCANARDAIDGPGTITIETANRSFDAAYCARHIESRPGRYVMLAVTDDGCGMDEETMRMIFEPFFTTKGQGTGLGLSTVYGIVSQNGGFINVYSEPRKGTTVKVYLPCHEGPGDVDAVAKAVVEPKGKAAYEITVLLVEDDPASLRITKALLETMGCRVIAAGSPREALKKADENAHIIDIVLTDVIMPEMDGRRMYEAIRSAHPHVRCLYMSGYTANVIMHRGVLEKGVHFIQKPFSRRELESRLHEALGRVSPG